MFGHTQLRVAAPVALALGALLLAAPGALAAQQVISSDGPLTKIYLNDNLACSADHEGDSHAEFFGGTDPGACGTFLSVGRASYGPAVPADPVQRTPFKPVSQTPVTGAGTATDPLKVVTVGPELSAGGVDSPTLGLRAAERERSLEIRAARASLQRGCGCLHRPGGRSRLGLRRDDRLG